MIRRTMTVGLKTNSMLQQAQSLANGIIAWRRTIHAKPELGFAERETAKLVADALRKMGYEVQENVGGTGVVASMRTPGYNGPFIGIRADMDALPIVETNACDYAAKNGAMHACGHDAHVACALGAAKLLSNAVATREVTDFAVRFLFQPAEETVNADGKSGATLLMEGGALKDVARLIALHVFPKVPTGMIAVRSGALLAACDTFTIKVKGKGCHGAFPEQGVDAIVLATQLVQALQTLVSRRKPANDAAVLTVGGIRSSSFAPNVVADEVELTGTVRYFAPEIRELFRREIERACTMVEIAGGSFELKYQHETPALNNDPGTTAVVKATAEALVGSSNVLEVGQQLGADDFSFYTSKVPSCYFVLGVNRPDRETELHSPDFDLNEEALPIGAAMLAQSAIALSAAIAKGK
jgi:amidohydrolase